jgi:hypothetical protein
MNVIVPGVKGCGGANAGPHDRCQTHRQGDSANPIIYVTERWPHCVGGNPSDRLDNFLAPPKLGDDLLVGEGGEGRSVAPSVHRDMMLPHILGLEDGGEGNCSGTNYKECGLERILVEEVQEVGGVVRGTVIVGKTPSVYRGAICDISAADTSTTRPPTTSGIRGSLWVGRAPPSYSNTDIRDLYAGGLNLGNPLGNLRGVRRGNSVKLGVIGGMNGR